MDADWANDKTDRISYEGYVLQLAGAAISWKSRKQKCVATSTTEAEYVSLEPCAKQAIVFGKIIKEILKVDNYHTTLLSDETDAINEICDQSVTILNDNQSAIKNANSADIKEKSKHIDVKYHFIKGAVSDKLVSVEYCPTGKMVADVCLTAFQLATKNIMDGCKIKYCNTTTSRNSN